MPRDTAVQPWVGPPADTTGTCAYAPTPADPSCGRPATTHVASYSHPWEKIVALSTCDAHEPIARAAGRFYRAHPYDPATCSHPNAWWNWDGPTQCVIHD